MNINFEQEAWHSLAPMPRSQRVVLSTEQIAEHEREFDEYMARVYQSGDIVRGRDIKAMSDWIFAVTGRLFVRVVTDENASQASMPDEDNVQYMVLNMKDLFELFEIAMEVLEEHPVH